MPTTLRGSSSSGVRHSSSHYAVVQSRGWAKASACCFQMCLSCAILCPSRTRLVNISTVSLVFSFRSFPLVTFLGGDTRYPLVVLFICSLLCPALPCPIPSSDLFSHVCDPCFSQYPDVYFSVPVHDVSNTLFMPLPVCVLPGWRMSTFRRRMSLLEVGKRCKPVSLNNVYNHP